MAVSNREAMWTAMRAARTFTLDELSGRTGLNRETINSYLRGLLKAGFLARAGSRPSPLGNSGGFARAEYVLVRDVGLDAPRVTKDGRALPPTGRQRMWRAMGILKEFSPRDLALVASLPEAPVAEAEAETYCKWLARGGYLKSYMAGRYLALAARRTGPRAPVVQRIKRLYDPNTRTVAYETHPAEDAS